MKKAFQLSLMLAVLLLMGVSCEDKDNYEEEEEVVIIETIAPTNITDSTAMSGCMLSIPSGHTIVEFGVCWNTTPKPYPSRHNYCPLDLDEKSYDCQITGLTPGTRYYVRAYAKGKRSDGDWWDCFGDDMVFYTSGGGFNGHAYVDLGLPSGTLWATCNVGANAPEECGDYFAWAETETKSVFDWCTYKYDVSSDPNWPAGITKYCKEPEFCLNGYTDNLRVLLPSDDAATVNWGGSWRTPTDEEFSELCIGGGVTQEWTNQNGVDGILLTGSNGNQLFLPAINDTLNGFEGETYNWSSTLVNSRSARFFNFHPNGGFTADDKRCHGFPVRPVCSAPQR